MLAASRINSCSCSLILAATPLDAARARLTKELQREIDRHSIELLVGGQNELVLRLTDDVFERVDPLWKCLSAIDQESRRPNAPPLRVELVPHPDPRICNQQLELTRGYFFKKQRADPARISVVGSCSTDAGVPR